VSEDPSYDAIAFLNVHDSVFCAPDMGDDLMRIDPTKVEGWLFDKGVDPHRLLTAMLTITNLEEWHWEEDHTPCFVTCIAAATPMAESLEWPDVMETIDYLSTSASFLTLRGCVFESDWDTAGDIIKGASAAAASRWCYFLRWHLLEHTDVEEITSRFASFKAEQETFGEI